MLDHKTQAAFLKALIAYEDNEASRQLQDNLAKADREREFHPSRLVLDGDALHSFLGRNELLCPSAAADLFQSRALRHQSLNVLGLASLICQLEFFGYLLWHRVTVNRLHKECRRRVLLLIDSQPQCFSAPETRASFISQGPGIHLRRRPESPADRRTIAGTSMNSKTLGIRFFPIVTFVVNCKPADTKPADNHYEGSKRSMNGACRLAESSVRAHRKFAAMPAPGSAVTEAGWQWSARIKRSKP